MFHFLSFLRILPRSREALLSEEIPCRSRECYDDEEHNCFTFVLDFVRTLQLPALSHLNRTQFCSQVICPRMKSVARYVTLYRKLEADSVYVKKLTDWVFISHRSNGNDNCNEKPSSGLTSSRKKSERFPGQWESHKPFSRVEEKVIGSLEEFLIAWVANTSPRSEFPTQLLHQTMVFHRQAEISSFQSSSRPSQKTHLRILITPSSVAI